MGSRDEVEKSLTAANSKRIKFKIVMRLSIVQVFTKRSAPKGRSPVVGSQGRPLPQGAPRKGKSLQKKVHAKK